MEANQSNKIETAISETPIPTVISGRTLTPGVSSSKNLSSPALDAGKGAFFFFFWLNTFPLALGFRSGSFYVFL
jgi:hypothetical protein